MNLKPFVNNPELWNAFLEEIDKQIESVNKQIAQLDEPKDLYRCQGDLRTLNKMKKLRDKINYGSQHG